MFLSIQAHRREGIVTMASQSKDGEIIARWLDEKRLLGRARLVDPGRVAGAQGDGAARARRQLGGSDGRRAHRPAAASCSPASSQLARLSGAWILPITSSSARPRFLASWDRYLLPRPFSRNVVVYGEPFPVPRDAAPEETADRIAAALDDATREADLRMGITPPDVWTR